MPKYKNRYYMEIRDYVREIISTLCKYKDVEIFSGAGIFSVLTVVTAMLR